MNTQEITTEINQHGTPEQSKMYNIRTEIETFLLHNTDEFIRYYATDKIKEAKMNKLNEVFKNISLLDYTSLHTLENNFHHYMN